MKKITRKEALQISLDILKQAEQERLEYAEREAMKGIWWNEKIYINRYRR